VGFRMILNMLKSRPHGSNSSSRKFFKCIEPEG
jgi:hypothetical protein